MMRRQNDSKNDAVTKRLQDLFYRNVGLGCERLRHQKIPYHRAVSKYRAQWWRGSTSDHMRHILTWHTNKPIWMENISVASHANHHLDLTPMYYLGSFKWIFIFSGRRSIRRDSYNTVSRATVIMGTSKLSLFNDPSENCPWALQIVYCRINDSWVRNS